MEKIKTKEDVLCNLSECVRYKTLWNTANRLQIEIRRAFEGGSSLMFSFEDKKTKQEIQNAIVCLEKFKRTLKLKPKYEKFCVKHNLRTLNKLIKDTSKTEVTKFKGKYHLLHICKNGTPVPLLISKEADEIAKEITLRGF